MRDLHPLPRRHRHGRTVRREQVEDALQVWADKTRRDAYREDAPAKTKVLNPGKRLEPAVVAMLREDHCLDVVAVNERYTHPVHIFLSVEIDFEWLVTEQALAAFPWLASLELGSIQNGEVKTAHPFVAHEWGDMGTDDVPIYYAAQSITGLQTAMGVGNQGARAGNQRLSDPR